jgi:two-component system, chemotaxis family, chemotaxis protein CheY
MRALIVDDSRFARCLLRRLLEKRGVECEEAADGQSALDCIRECSPFDLALVDWNMPVMNGLEMVEQMRADGYLDTKVLMVTTESDNDYITRALDAGADEFLMKPFDEEAFGDKLAMMGVETGAQ